jgi:lysozyme
MISLLDLSGRRRSLVAVTLALALASAGAAVFAAPRPVSAGASFMEGIDVSRWQRQPNWASVKAAGIRFVFAKATQGTTVVDPQWTRNKARLRANEIPFSGYHYADPDATPGDAMAEADHFVNTAKLDKRNLLPVLDLEKHNEQSSEFLAEWAKAWLARVEERLRVKPLIYTTNAFWIERMGDTTWFADNGYRLWIRSLNVETPTVPAANWGGHGWTLWQYAVLPGLDGISGKVDRNRYEGDTLIPIRIKYNR